MGLFPFLPHPGYRAAWGELCLSANVHGLGSLGSIVPGLHKARRCGQGVGISVWSNLRPCAVAPQPLGGWFSPCCFSGRTAGACGIGSMTSASYA